MLFSLGTGWRLFWIDVIIYALLQVIRILVDVLLPRWFYAPERFIFRSFSWEDEGRFYEKYLKVNLWKDHLPAVDSLNDFNKKHLKSISPEYLDNFEREINMGESHHWRSILTTLLFSLWNPLPMFLLVLILSCLIQLPFIIIQRYNRPRIRRLIQLNQKRIAWYTKQVKTGKMKPEDNPYCGNQELSVPFRKRFRKGLFR